MVTSPTVSFTLLKLKSMAMHISPSGKAGGQPISCRVISAEFTSTDVMGHTSDGFEDDDGSLLKLGAEGSSDGLVGSEEGLEDGFEELGALEGSSDCLVGSEDGLEDGFEELGALEGSSDCLVGSEDGLDDGFEELGALEGSSDCLLGAEDGTSGKNFNDGCDEDLEDGRRDGIEEGFEESPTIMADGSDDALKLGSEEASSDGLVGSEEGFEDGRRDGIEEGSEGGSNDGSTLELELGALDGSSEDGCEQPVY
jgi:hypothetical protein